VCSRLYVFDLDQLKSNTQDICYCRFSVVKYLIRIHWVVLDVKHISVQPLRQGHTLSNALLYARSAYVIIEVYDGHCVYGEATLWNGLYRFSL